MEDPLPVPASLEQEVLGATFRLHNIVLTGMRDYEVKQVQVDLKGHEVSRTVILECALGPSPIHLSTGRQRS